MTHVMQLAQQPGIVAPSHLARGKSEQARDCESLREPITVATIASGEQRRAINLRRPLNAAGSRMPASHPRTKLSKLCTATARCVGERSTGPRVWTRHRAAKASPKSVGSAQPGARRGEGNRVKGSSQSVAFHARLRMISVAPEPLSRTRLISTRSSVGATAALVKVLRSLPHHDFAAWALQVYNVAHKRRADKA